MNFDELKKQWDNQPTDDLEINPDLYLKREANTVIDKVRKTLKKDFFFQLTTIPILLTLPYFFGLNNMLVWWIIICLCITLVVPLGYIFKFYKKSYKLEYNSLKSINWFYYNYKSSIDVYFLYTLIFCILMIMFIGVISIENESFKRFENIFNYYIYNSIILLVYISFSIWGLKWWINRLYKKPLLELETIVNQLEE